MKMVKCVHAMDKRDDVYGIWMGKIGGYKKKGKYVGCGVNTY